MEMQPKMEFKMEIDLSSQEKATKATSTGGIEDYELPKAAINRCLKNALPGRPSHKDLKTALSRSATLFVPWLVAAAQQVAIERNVKTIGASHIEEALRRLGFAEWIDTIVERIRLEQEEKQSRKRRKQQSATVDEVDKDIEREDVEEENNEHEEEELVVDEEKQSEDEEVEADDDGNQEAF